MTMLHNCRNVVQCSYGCCKERVSNGLLRRRERRRWMQEETRRG